MRRQSQQYSRLKRKSLARFRWLALPTGLLVITGILAVAVLSSVVYQPGSVDTTSVQAEQVSEDAVVATSRPAKYTPWRLQIPVLNLEPPVQD